MPLPFVCSRCQTGYPAHVPFCRVCLVDGCVGPRLERRGAAVDREPELTNARALAAASWTLVELPAYPAIRVMKGALVLLYGDPGAGKSTMALQMLDGIRAPVLAVLAEERLGPAVGERLGRLGIRRADFHLLGRSTVDDLVDVARRQRVRAVLIDSVSVTTLLPPDARHLIQRLDLGALLGVVQVTKDGTMRGSNEWKHDADVVIRVEAGRWTLEKSRFQEAPGPCGPVLFTHDPEPEPHAP